MVSMLGEEHPCNNTHCRHRARDAVRRAPDRGMCLALEGTHVSADFRRHVACDQFDEGRTGENVRRKLKNRCDTHGCRAGLALPAPGLCKRMDLEDVAALGGTGRNTVFIGRNAAVAQVKIVFKVMMPADKQEQATPGGQVIEHD